MELFGKVDTRPGAARSDSLPDKSSEMAYGG
jgi:hypothetical protein